MSGTNKTVQSSIEGKKGSPSAMVSALSDANTKAVEILGEKKEKKNGDKKK